MKNILSIQSHVVHGYVGNKAAIYPLQYMGYDVWPINTVQFSNHTGYGKWQGEVFAAKHVLDLVEGLEDLGVLNKCSAIISGYMGSMEICCAIEQIVKKIKQKNPNAVYLCDPVMGEGNNCYVKPEVVDFFVNKKICANIVTPNHFEAEKLSRIKIKGLSSLKEASSILHQRGAEIVVITGLHLFDMDRDLLYTFASDATNQYLIGSSKHELARAISGTGDLFSSLYIGNFLKKGNFAESLQISVFYLNRVLANTRELNVRELQVLSVRYDDIQKVYLPQLIKID